MSAKTERAEAGARVRITEDDRAYTGVARHPLARQWMLKRLIEARDRAQTADSPQAEARWAAEVDRVAGELRRCGFSIGAAR